MQYIKSIMICSVLSLAACATDAPRIAPESIQNLPEIGTPNMKGYNVLAISYIENEKDIITRPDDYEHAVQPHRYVDTHNKKQRTVSISGSLKGGDHQHSLENSTPGEDATVRPSDANQKTNEDWFEDEEDVTIDPYIPTSTLRNLEQDQDMKISDIWNRYCTGEELSQEEYASLDTHPIPEVWRDNCFPPK